MNNKFSDFKISKTSLNQNKKKIKAVTASEKLWFLALKAKTT